MLHYLGLIGALVMFIRWHLAGIILMLLDINFCSSEALYFLCHIVNVRYRQVNLSYLALIVNAKHLEC